VKYVVAMDCEETSIVVYQEQEPHWTVTINLTSPAVRQQPTDEGNLHHVVVIASICDM